MSLYTHSNLKIKKRDYEASVFVIIKGKRKQNEEIQFFFFFPFNVRTI